MSESTVAPVFGGTNANHAEDRPWITWLIVFQGIVTLLLVFASFPVGVMAVIANAVLAFATRGLHRRLFAGFAVIGGVLCLFVAMTLLTVSFSGTVHVSELSATLL